MGKVDLRPRRFRITGLDTNGDIHCFETNDRHRAKAKQAQFDQELGYVEWETQRWI